MDDRQNFDDARPRSDEAPPASDQAQPRDASLPFMPRRRFLIDAQFWWVYEVRPLVGASSDPTVASGWLCFEHSDVTRRRLSPIPENWETMSETELAMLWESAV